MYEKCIIMLCNVALLASHGSLDVDGDHYNLIMNSQLPSPCAQFTLPTKNVRKKRRKKKLSVSFQLDFEIFFSLFDTSTGRTSQTRGSETILQNARMR